MSDLRDFLLNMSDDGFDPIAKKIVIPWGDTDPTSLQVLEVLDACIFGSLCSGTVVSILQVYLNIAMDTEKVTMGDLVPQAVWRQRDYC